MVLSDGLTLAKQMETAERLSNTKGGGKVKFLRILKQCQYSLDCRNPLSLSFCYYIYIYIYIEYRYRYR